MGYVSIYAMHNGTVVHTANSWSEFCDDGVLVFNHLPDLYCTEYLHISCIMEQLYIVVRIL